MPPDGYTTVTISDSLAERLTRIIALHDQSSYADAIEYAVDTTLTSEDEITATELIQMLTERIDELE
jgi:hypothetical protein